MEAKTNGWVQRSTAEWQQIPPSTPKAIVTIPGVLGNVTKMTKMIKVTKVMTKMTAAFSIDDRGVPFLSEDRGARGGFHREKSRGFEH